MGAKLGLSHWGRNVGLGYLRIGSWSCSQAVSKPVWHIPLLCVQWKTPDDGHRNCPKHAEFYSKNIFEKLVHLVGFVVRNYHDAWSPERQIKIFSNISTTFVRVIDLFFALQLIVLLGWAAVSERVFRTVLRVNRHFIAHVLLISQSCFTQVNCHYHHHHRHHHHHHVVYQLISFICWS
jgi:hypothetical protein